MISKQSVVAVAALAAVGQAADSYSKVTFTEYEACETVSCKAPAGGWGSGGTAALNVAAYGGTDSDNYNKAGCGQCWELTLTEGADGSPAKSDPVVVKVNNACPDSGNMEWCHIPDGGLNKHGGQAHFDLCKSTPAMDILKNAGGSIGKGTAKKVSCTDASSGAVPAADEPAKPKDDYKQEKSEDKKLVKPVVAPGDYKPNTPANSPSSSSSAAAPAGYTPAATPASPSPASTPSPGQYNYPAKPSPSPDTPAESPTESEDEGEDESCDDDEEEADDYDSSSGADDGPLGDSPSGGSSGGAADAPSGDSPSGGSSGGAPDAPSGDSPSGGSSGGAPDYSSSAPTDDSPKTPYVPDSQGSSSGGQGKPGNYDTSPDAMQKQQAEQKAELDHKQQAQREQVEKNNQAQHHEEEKSGQQQNAPSSYSSNGATGGDEDEEDCEEDDEDEQPTQY